MYKALKLAIMAHDGQLRKYTNEPYILHPIAVAEIVNTVTLEKDMLRAAILHDTVEDTDVQLHQILNKFGSRVAEMVSDLTDISRVQDGNRAMRKKMDREHTANSHPDSKTIKLADLIHNTESIVQYDGHFAKVYMKEKQLLLEVLKEGDKRLFDKANQLIMDYYMRKLNERHT